MAEKHEHRHHEFESEHPSLAERTLYKTGEHVKEDGAYQCVNCTKEPAPPMINLHKGDMIPVCVTCGPLSRWSHI